ncbi:hypothetical protein BVRB_4g079890 [Beta vulgaris subsp. vulgaris]|uniref:uncharacterized protein LOC104890665 isoform X2 n=1 Tax=Beta vulgaris subsp. vulgaris TaxID=3555 RepID=UPI00053F4DAC|nr:uncharacterized protein LOC104890665 isoform X2 [Beta vulgaris subsp. vulgaris]KMT14171.1 hypothetical protein BVRB_4g079890 [Beta vulgaris subsp. vulgaris]
MVEGKAYVVTIPVNEQVKNQNSPTQKYARVVSNVYSDDIYSGGSDSIVVQNENASNILELSVSVNSDVLDGSSSNQVNCGEITSESSANSWETCCSSDDNISRIQIGSISNGILTFTREIPEHACTTEVRKVTFKIRVEPEDSERIPLKQQSTSVIKGSKKRKGLCGRKRDDSLHQLIFGRNGIPDGSKLTYRVNGQDLLQGYKKGNGIFCDHCSNEISPSGFEAHAKMSVKKRPYQYIYLLDKGCSLHEYAIQLNEQNQTALKKNDDKIRTIRLTRAVKKSGVDNGRTCVLCSRHDHSVNKFDDRIIIICEQCEKGYHVGCLRKGGLCDLKELPTRDKWFCCYDCARISVALNDRVVRGSEAIPSSELSKINRKLLEKGLCKVADDDAQWRLLSGKHCISGHLPLLSKAIYLFREGFSLEDTLTGRDLIPLMVNGKNAYGQDYRGMYCVILTAKSVVVSVGVLRIFGQKIAELPLVATRKRYRGKGYFKALFLCIKKLLCSLKVEKLVVAAVEETKTMWVDKFGFEDVSQEKLVMYMKEFRLAVFSGTVMLEKQLDQQQMD